jgi:hypothetical protein
MSGYELPQDLADLTAYFDRNRVAQPTADIRCEACDAAYHVSIRRNTRLIHGLPLGACPCGMSRQVLADLAIEALREDCKSWLREEEPPYREPGGASRQALHDAGRLR